MAGLTVADLIAKLSKCDPSAQVVVSTTDYEHEWPIGAADWTVKEGWWNSGDYEWSDHGTDDGYVPAVKLTGGE